MQYTVVAREHPSGIELYREGPYYWRAKAETVAKKTSRNLGPNCRVEIEVSDGLEEGFTVMRVFRYGRVFRSA